MVVNCSFVEPFFLRIQLFNNIILPLVKHFLMPLIHSYAKNSWKENVPFPSVAKNFVKICLLLRKFNIKKLNLADYNGQIFCTIQQKICIT